LALSCSKLNAPVLMLEARLVSLLRQNSCGRRTASVESASLG